MIGYDKILRDSIKDEKKGIDYNYTSNDKIIFKKMLKEINELTHRRFRYLAELDYYDIPNSGPIIAKYICSFESEDMKGYLIPQLVSDKVKDCDLLILELYNHYRIIENEIVKSGKLTPPHIYVRYDNAFKDMKSKRIKDDLLKFARNPIDAFRLPLTIELLAKWKIPEMREILFVYLEQPADLSERLGINVSDTEEYDIILTHIKRELRFRAINGLKYYPDTEVYEKLKSLLSENDIDVKSATKKSIRRIENKLVDSLI